MIGGAIRVLLASAIVMCCEEVDEYLARRRGRSQLRPHREAFYGHRSLQSSPGYVIPESYEEDAAEHAVA